MSTRLYQSFPYARRQRGVALLVTIILLVFLVLIMVAMSSIVRVETQIAVNTQALAQARQNAMVGLNIAIGKLQETAGADQRVTARADLVTAAASNQLNLTGVWDTTASPPTLITWLVNGNENHAAGAPNVLPNSGNLIIPDARDLTTLPDPLYNDVAPAATAAAATPRFSAGHVYMVARGSVDLKNGPGYKQALTERVILRKSPIEVDGSKVPGRAPGSMVVVGNYAFWVADDGIKASLSTGNRTANVAYDDSAIAGDGMDYIPAANSAADASYISRKKLNTILLQAGRLDLVLQDFGANDLFDASAQRSQFYGALVHPVNYPLFNGISTAAQLDYSIFGPFSPAANPPDLPNIPPTTAAGVDAYQEDIHDRLKQAFHDVAPQTYSVLANSANGALRSDLSQRAVLNALPGAQQDAVKAFVNAWRPSNGIVVPAANTNSGLLHHEITITAPVAAEFGAGNASYPLVPVITEFELMLQLSADGGGAIQFSPGGQVELWNPYNAVMKLSAGQNLYVKIPLVAGSNELFSVVRVSDGTNSGNFSLARNLGWNGTDTDYSVTLNLTANVLADWAPGESKAWTIEPSAYQTPAARDPAGLPLAGFTVVRTEMDVSTANSSSLAVNLVMGAAANATSILTSSATLTLGRAAVAARAHPVYYFALQDEPDIADWLANVGWDPRSLVPNAAVYNTPFAVNALTNFDGDANSYLFNDSHGAAAHYAVLFDVPTQEVLSVGALRHLVYGNDQGPYRVGSSGGGGAVAANTWFDNYYFSSVPRDPAAGWSPKNGDVLANGSMVVFDPAFHQDSTNAVLLAALQTANSSEYLLLRDSFNVNSTSIAAWRALLGGVLPALANPALVAPNGQDFLWNAASREMAARWRYFDGAGDTTTTLRNAFFRCPQTATNVNGNFLTLTDHLEHRNGATKLQQDAASYRLGVRSLTDAQVGQLAINLVNLLQTPPAGINVPFASVAEFVDSGLLQQAIDNANTNINTPSGFAIIGGSPGFLSQGDILELIGHRLVARSDTFTIRAYGDVINPVSGEVESRAWVEATVQRTPVKHSTATDAGNNMTSTGSGAGNFGRQFKVVKLRWLGQEEI